MVYKSIDHRKVPSIFFYNNMEKVRAELILFSVKKARVTSDVIFIVCTLIDKSYEPISAREFEQLL